MLMISFKAHLPVLVFHASIKRRKYIKEAM